MRKLLLATCAFVFLFAANAFGACTAEEFQTIVLEMQTAMTEIGKNPEKAAEANGFIEKEYKDEIIDFAMLAQEVGADAGKAQAMIDKGCDLYGRINKDLAKYK